MQASFDERELLAIVALAGAAFWLPHAQLRVSLSALKAAIVWDLAEGGRIQAESDAFQLDAPVKVQGQSPAHSGVRSERM
jgi:hypothetical protein